VNKWLFQEDYFLSFDQSALEALNLQANLPISYNDFETKPNEEVLSMLLVTLDPNTINKIQFIAHGLHHTDALVIESRTKFKIMDNSNFITKITRTKFYLHPAKGLKDDPVMLALIAKFDSVLKQFQQDNTNVVICCLVMEYLHFCKKLLSSVLKGLFPGRNKRDSLYSNTTPTTNAEASPSATANQQCRFPPKTPPTQLMYCKPPQAPPDHHTPNVIANPGISR
jgi:hypothetical protein